MYEHSFEYNFPKVAAVPHRRAQKIRTSWFILGTTFGVIFASLLTYVFTNRDVISGESQEVALAVEDTTTVQVDTAKKSPSFPVSVAIEARQGDTLLSMLTDTGVAYDEAYNVVEAIKEKYNPKRLNVGQNVALNLDRSKDNARLPSVKSLAIAVSPLQTLKLTRTTNGNFKVSQVTAPLTKSLVRGGGRINSSLYETGIESGIPPALLGELINAYSYDVDFQRDIKSGDQLDVVFERLSTKDGYAAGHENVIYASLDLGDRELKLYRYTDKNGNSDYYNEKGESIKKALLKTPINGARISSGFGMRHHPIMGYTKMHKGVDFAAATGTPIYAAGDGKIEFQGRKGGYGNYLRVKHNEKYATAYAHLSRFAKGVSVGSKVRQGQVIAYVGSTGNSTGPHLHYEVLMQGAQVNPKGIKFPTGNTLSGRELANFKEVKAKMETQLASLPSAKTQVAANDASSDSKKN